MKPPLNSIWTRDTADFSLTRASNSLSVQSFSRASVILNLSEPPWPGDFPATFRLSVVPRPWSMIVSNTVRLFLNRFPNESQSFSKEAGGYWRWCLMNSDITWRWGGRRHCGCWQVWTSHWMTWLLQAAGGGCTQTVWRIPRQTLNCSWLRMSNKQTEGHLDSFHMLPLSQTGGLWCNYHNFWTI